MKFCPQCKTEYKDIYNFCLKDGTTLEVFQESDNSVEDEQETVFRTGKSSVEDETIAMMNTPSFEQVTPITEEESFQQPTEEWQSETPAAQWQQQESSSSANYEQQNPANENAFAAANIPIDQGQTSEDEYQVQPEKSRSSMGLIIGGLALFGILLLGTVIGGVYLFMLSQEKGEVASANTNSENGSAPNSSDEDQQNDLTIGNAEDQNNTTNSEDETSVNADKANKTKDDEKNKEKTPTPTPNKNQKDDKTNSTNRTTSMPDDDDPPSPPPPLRTQTPTTQSTRPNVPSRIAGGVVNGKATYLPKPAYPATARAANIKGSVNVAVVIDKSGKVISASAVSGHPLLRASAVSAARNSRFSPTNLSGQAVEVSGVIVYNFQ